MYSSESRTARSELILHAEVITHFSALHGTRELKSCRKDQPRDGRGPWPTSALYWHDWIGRRQAPSPISQEVLGILLHYKDLVELLFVTRPFSQFSGKRPGSKRYFVLESPLPLSSRKGPCVIACACSGKHVPAPRPRESCTSRRPARWPMRARAGRLNFPCAFRRFEKGGTRGEPWSSVRTG